MRSDKRGEAILQAFPGPITLHPSRTKWILMLLSCAFFGASGAWMVAKGASGGWPCLIFFGLGTIVAIRMLWPGMVSLKLDQNGLLETRLLGFRASRWQDVSGFASVSIGLWDYVLYDNANVVRPAIGALNPTGKNAALMDTYGLSAADLARVMARWRDRALASPPRD
jgi:hypothetical protein